MKKLNFAKICFIGSIILLAGAIIETVYEVIDNLTHPNRMYPYIGLWDNWIPLALAAVLLVAGIIIRIIRKKKNNASPM